jgi:hypothetical protein
MSGESDETLLDGPDWALIPESDRAALNRFLRFGIAPCPFLMAVVCNDMCGAVRHAKGDDLARLGDFAQFVLAHTPPGSCGSPEAVAHWIARGGLEGGPPAALLRAVLFLLGSALTWETCAASVHLLEEML